MFRLMAPIRSVLLRQCLMMTNVNNFNRVAVLLRRQLPLSCCCQNRLFCRLIDVRAGDNRATYVDRSNLSHKLFRNNLNFRYHTKGISSFSTKTVLISQLIKELKRSNVPLDFTLKHQSTSTASDANVDSEQAEKQKQREKQQKYTKITLIVLTLMFGGFSLYALIEWGAPRLDENGAVIEDEFSHLPLPLQYFNRAWDTLLHYNEILKEPSRDLLLPPPVEPPYYQPPYTLVLEMTGVLVRAEWEYKTGWRFKKRPFIEYLLQHCAASGLFEIVIYTKENGFTAFPLLDSLDPNGFIAYRLFRDSTRYEKGVHKKDLNCINRDLSKVIMVDWDKNACNLNSSNCLTLKKWDGDSKDRGLYDLAHFLKAIATTGVQDVREVLNHYSQFEDPLEAFKENQRKLAEQEREAAEKQSQPTTPLSKLGWKRK